MNTNIYSNKIIVFKGDAVDALKATSEISSKSYCYTVIFESVVTVLIDTDVEKPEYGRSIDKTMKECVDVLKKYNIEYKLKGMKF